MAYGILAALLLFNTALGLTVPQAHRETIGEAAVNTKKLIHDVSTGTMASVFPEGTDHAGRPFALMEYHAPCHPSPSLTFLLLPVSLSTRNILNTPSHRATYTVQTPTQGVKSPMSKGRVAFIGNVTTLPDISGDEQKELEKCYLKYHPDAKYWVPGAPDTPHFAVWARFDIDDIYYVGGFGDTHYIGHIPLSIYTKAGEKDAELDEWEAVLSGAVDAQRTFGGEDLGEE
ncbi:hypothetical protein IAT38_006526 [Cryptococcus sp. DSM 104549]